MQQSEESDATHPVAKHNRLYAAFHRNGADNFRMDALSPTLWLCTAMLVVAAGALSAFELTQRSYRGFQWWSGALWLNAAAAAAVALADATLPAALPLLQSLFVPWPVLCLLGLRSFHARLALLGSARADLVLLGLVLATAMLAPQLGGDAAASAAAPWVAGSAALLYAAAVAWHAPKGCESRALQVVGALWFAMAALQALASAWSRDAQGTVLQASVVALGSTVMAFMVLAMTSQRTEHALRQSRSRLRVLANIDMLTQVPNRRRFEELARRALAADVEGSATLLLVDIDHFKQINDQLGHAAGDRALKLVSRCTLELLRGNDVVGRHGGDEFVMLLRRSSTRDAMRVAERLVSHLQHQASAHALPRLTLSFGIVQFRQGETIDETLHRADLALYEAKRLGRCRAVACDGDSEQPAFHSSERLGLTSS
jgi:diguanylate cyclase (GGDEF)-like protein